MLRPVSLRTVQAWLPEAAPSVPTRPAAPGPSADMAPQLQQVMRPAEKLPLSRRPVQAPQVESLAATRVLPRLLDELSREKDLVALRVVVRERLSALVEHLEVEERDLVPILVIAVDGDARLEPRLGGSVLEVDVADESPEEVIGVDGAHS